MRTKVDYLTERTYYMDKEYQEIGRGANNAIVYGEIRNFGRHEGKPWAIGFQGKRGKPDWNFIFPSIERRDDHIRQWFEGIESRLKFMGELKESRIKPAEQKLIPGVILYSNWGYDQTNIDYYRVVKRTGSYVWVEKMGSHDVGNDRVIPYGSGNGKLYKHRVQKWDGEEHGIRLTSFSSAYPWDGTPKYETPIGCGH